MLIVAIRSKRWCQFSGCLIGRTLIPLIYHNETWHSLTSTAEYEAGCENLTCMGFGKLVMLGGTEI